MSPDCVDYCGIHDPFFPSQLLDSLILLMFVYKMDGDKWIWVDRLDIYASQGTCECMAVIHHCLYEALLFVPCHNLSFGSRAFRIFAPKIWNTLPLHIRQSQSLSAFRRHVKTHYFQLAYPAT